MDKVDSLIEFAVVNSYAESGVPAEWLIMNGAIQPSCKSKKNRAARWTPEEDRYLDEKLGYLTIEQVGSILGRTSVAINIRRIRREIHSPSKRPGWLTGTKTAKDLGVDIDNVMKMKKYGIMPMDVLPGVKGILQIKRVSLYVWAIKPDHWVCFKVGRMGDVHLQRLVMLAQSRWDDEWWNAGRVAFYHGVNVRQVNFHILTNRLPAIRWGNWYIKRSDAIRYHFNHRPGGPVKIWSPGADAFLLRAKAMGLGWETIERMMKWPAKRAAYRYSCLMRN
jgi:hypothetical protein